ncbi:hypothetical protein T492DRAFT_110196 [Pavlovales sp. CCMP2436]|nr:hypothetical protein T492DRAFT_110196 [Pavlovales sp. CCMP2436]
MSLGGRPVHRYGHNPRTPARREEDDPPWPTSLRADAAAQNVHARSPRAFVEPIGGTTAQAYAAELEAQLRRQLFAQQELQRVNVQLVGKLDEYREANGENVRAAEAELLSLHAELTVSHVSRTELRDRVEELEVELTTRSAAHRSAMSTSERERVELNTRNAMSNSERAGAGAEARTAERRTVALEAEIERLKSTAHEYAVEARIGAMERQRDARARRLGERSLQRRVLRELRVCVVEFRCVVYFRWTSAPKQISTGPKR